MKLKSRTFWITVITAAYFALMALKEQGVNNTAGTIACSALAVFIAFGYVVMEKWLDADKIESAEEGELIEEDDGEAKE